MLHTDVLYIPQKHSVIAETRQANADEDRARLQGKLDEITSALRAAGAGADGFDNPSDTLNVSCAVVSCIRCYLYQADTHVS